MTATTGEFQPHVTREIYAKIGAAVVAAYKDDRAGVAAICDERLDRSGAMLGWLRVAIQNDTREGQD